MKQKAMLGVASALMIIASAAQANDCFPPEIEPGMVVEGKKFMFLVKDINQCWIKAVICTDVDRCREDPYWIHATTIEAFKAKN